MRLLSGLRSFAHTCLARKTARGASRRRLTGTMGVPRLEALEDRALPSTLTVMNLNDSGRGSLRAAIGSAGNGDTIAFASELHGTLMLTSNELLLTTSVTIDGPGANQLTVSGNNAYRVFEISNDASVHINHLAIANGSVSGSNGGGILVDAGASLDLDHVLMTNNNAFADALGNAGNGGGIENDGSLTVTESTFANNLASGGVYTNSTEGSVGGAIDTEGPSLTVANCTFSGNRAIGAPSTGTGEGNGGAINSSSTTTISNSTFTGNQALGRTTNGGAISTGENSLSTEPQMTISNCSFTANQAIGANGTNDFIHKFGGQAIGGAIANAGPLTLSNSSFTDNLAKGGDGGNNLNGIDGIPFVGFADGGGIALAFFANATITNTTFVGNQAIGGNSAAGLGGGAEGGGVDGFIGVTSTLDNVTFVGNQAIGGSGGNGYAGGTGFGGGFNSNVDSASSLSHTVFLANLAQGGTGGAGAAGGAGAGGAVANGGGMGQYEASYLYGVGLLSSPVDTSTLSLDHCQLVLNVAQGGACGSGSIGGAGLGGGAYVFGTTSASFTSTAIIANIALGGVAGTGGATGQGIGGGLYIDMGAVVTLATSSEVQSDFASTSADDVFGVYTT